jgi:hypothetical protein
VKSITKEILLANLEYISTSLEGPKTEEETQLDESLSECGVLRKRLREKRDRSCYWDSQLEEQIGSCASQ